MNNERQLAHLTARLTVTRFDGGTHSGTGFFVGYDVGNGHSKIYCVTNRHVLEGARECVVSVTRSGGDNAPMYGNSANVTIGDIADNSLFHPDADVDLAAFPFHGILNQMQSNGFNPYIRAINRTEIPDDALFSTLDIATDIVMIGYPNGLWDEHNNMPIVRRGTAATAPALDFNGKKQFAIDCACFPGSSGSPVFVYQSGGYTDQNGNYILAGNRVLLIGVLFAGPQFTIGGELVPKAIPTSMSVEVRSMIMMHLGYCIKSSEISWLDTVANE